MTEKEIEEIKKEYLAGKTYKDIQKKHDITNNQLIYLVQKSNWKRKSNRSKVMKKNKNAKGNSGGHAPESNKNAVITGEYENIFSGIFSEEEKNFFYNHKISNKKEVLIKELNTLIIRESRILKRIKKYENNKDMSIIRITELRSKGLNYKSNGKSTTTDKENNINIIHRLEDALTRVQDSIRKVTDSLNKLEIDNIKLKIEKEKLEIEKKRLELQKQNADGEEIEDTSETDDDIYGS